MIAFNSIQRTGVVLVVLSLVGLGALSFRQKDAFQERMVTESTRSAQDRNLLERGLGGSGLAGTGSPEPAEGACVPPGAESTDPCAPAAPDLSDE